MVKDEPPAVNVRTEDEIYRALVETTRAPQTLSELGRRSRQWVLENLHADVVLPRYVETYRTVMRERSSA
jgi:hypothetical protein